MKRDDEELVSAQEGYAQWAGHYDGQDNPMTAMVEHVVRQSTEAIDGARVLELGCGTGRNAIALREMGCASYLGVDNSPEMLAIAAKRAQADPSLQFKKRDLRGEWWADLGTFDIVIISLVLEHLEHVEQVIQRVRDVTSNNGLLWILEMHPELHSRDVGARVRAEGKTLLLPSFQHGIEEFMAAFRDAGWQPTTTTNWFATEILARQSAKLKRYCGRPVLLDIRALPRLNLGAR